MHSRHSQQGTILVISLVMLVLLTILGVSSVTDITVNEKMASNFRDYDQALQLAESALVEGEAWAENYDANFSQDDLDGACTGTTCFTSTCNNGQCFTGSYPDISASIPAGGSGSPGVCDTTIPATATWLTESNWNNAKTYGITIPGAQVQPKYLVEFLCYAPADPDAGTPTPPPPYGADWARMYRITALASGSSPDSQVMLQSTYKVIQN